jgi:excisionase family DNA binding protein
MNDRILTIPQVAECLQVSKAKIYLLVQTGQLPHIRIGKNVRVEDSEMRMWINQQPNQAGWSLLA